MNNLYGWVMSKYLPYEGFKWLKNYDNFHVISINEKSSIGYLLEVDFENSDELHELNDDYPLAPEKHFRDMLSKCCRKIADKYEIKVGDVKKLIPNLGYKLLQKSSVVFIFRNEID